MFKDNYENERSENRSCVVTSVYKSPLGSCDVQKGIEFLGTTFNASSSGVGIYTERPMTKGDVIFNVCSDALWDYPRNAVVRWCAKVGDGIYRTGLSLC